MTSDAGSSRNMLNRARLHVATGKTPVYLDMFARFPAAHGYDLPYWFNILDLPGAVVDPRRKIDATDHMIADRMSDAVVAFIKTGDPSTPTLKWPQYTRQNEVRMVFGDSPAMAPAGEGLKFFVDNPEIRTPSNPPGQAPARPAGAPL
jgi:carboxylesterase type B